MKLDIPYLLAHLTLEEKAGLCSGEDSWLTKAVERLGIPHVMVSDGPHGLRTQKEKVNGSYVGSIPSICFPTGAALASSYDTALLSKVGDALGEEARSEGVQTILGPAVNVKRSPLCGRNFEYLSEDPYLSGKLASSYVKAVQAHQVGVSLKHFAANSQETMRMSVNEHIDERTLREIYLTAFELVVKEAKPWTLMCSYNRINGTYSSENRELLTGILRDEWGHDGIVMSDWGAVNRRVDGIKAGLDLEMPGSNGNNDRKIVQAVKDSSLSMEELDKVVARLLSWIAKGVEKASAPYDKEAHHLVAREAAQRSAILLKNDSLLPLDSFKDVLFVGPFAKHPRYQGGGSSHINSYRVDDAFSFAPGVEWTIGMGEDSASRDEKAMETAVSLAKKAKAVVLFLGLPDKYESEGYDRKVLSLPPCQDELVNHITSVQPHVIVVLHHGSPVSMPWKDKVEAILDMYLGGEAVGSATDDLLLGKANPSGRLAETIPLRLEDTPCFGDFARGRHEAFYGEGVFVGYRWYDDRKMDTLFPFGYGLSYTTFSLSALRLSASVWKKGETVQANVDVTNTGVRDGEEVVELYVRRAEGLSVARPPKELKGFAKVFLKKGETKTVNFILDERSFAYWDDERHCWRAERGSYGILVGISSRNLPLEAELEVEEAPLPFVVTDTMTFGELLHSGKRFPALEKMMGQFMTGHDDQTLGEGAQEMIKEMMMAMPLHSLVSFMPVSYEQFLALLQ